MFALTMSLGFTLTLAMDTIEADGDWEQFEAGMHHYSDRLEWGPDGRLVMHRAAYPVATFFAFYAGTCVVTAASAWAFHRLGRRPPHVDGHAAAR